MNQKQRTRFVSIPFHNLCLLVGLLCCLQAGGQESELSDPPSSRQLESVIGQETKAAVRQAFQSTHDGWSSDEVLLNDKLQKKFIGRCREIVTGDISDFDLNWCLVNLRKAGKLEAKTTKQNRVDLTAVTPIAEIVTRSITDEFQVSTDRMICDPAIRARFDQKAREIEPEVDLYRVRKAAFRLRKTRKLRPELIARIADWGKKIEVFSKQQLLDNPNSLSTNPGIYLFSDSTGYLYIGQAQNLRKRLSQHLDQSHNDSLANYLGLEDSDSVRIEVHSFDADSRAKEVMIRRALESELIASRKPRFNIQP
ncbi:MAG: GIY-YIG nuclease family protein [Planctomycetota bacterium]